MQRVTADFLRNPRNTGIPECRNVERTLGIPECRNVGIPKEPSECRYSEIPESRETPESISIVPLARHYDTNKVLCTYWITVKKQLFAQNNAILFFANVGKKCISLKIAEEIFAQ